MKKLKKKQTIGIRILKKTKINLCQIRLKKRFFLVIVTNLAYNDSNNSEDDRMNKKVRLITVSTIAALGIFCIATGVMCAMNNKTETNKTVLVVVQKKQISNESEPVITLKNLEVPVNTPLSIKIIDYLESAVTDEVLANLQLDTSTVNVTESGTYSYTISYQDKVYTGTITVVEDQTQATAALPTITLKTLNIKVGTVLTNDIANYIVETIPDEAKALMTLDISQVNVNIAATYQYSITYNNSIYTGTITVTEDQPTLSAGEEEKQDQTEESETETEETETTIDTNTTTAITP